MTINMNDTRIISIAQIKEFAKITKDIQFKAASKKEKYEWIQDVLARFKYFSLKKKDKSTVKEYIMKMTGYSDAQITRLIKKKKKKGKIVAKEVKKHRFAKKYGACDIALIIHTDKVNEKLSGPATKRIFEREFNVFGKEDFKKLKDISVSHIYNLRKTRQYQSKALFFSKTKPNSVNIGERRKPNANGEPGFLRVDTVHQGDFEKEKGVYHINLIDETTQWEIVGSTEKISEEYLIPVLENALSQFPFKIKSFHSDNGSEFINKVAAGLLNKLLIEQTKSRARKCNDNALIEGKNGSVIRKHMGYMHIPQKYADKINKFYRDYFNLYLNYHRPCGFATVKIDRKGKERKIYNTYLTPFEAFVGKPCVSEFLKEGVTLEKLNEIAKKQSDNECAAEMQKAKQELFKNIIR